jgi:hypothetical protein
MSCGPMPASAIAAVAAWTASWRELKPVRRPVVE